MQKPAAPSTPRFDGVDALRGVCILSVVLLHTWLRLTLRGRSLNPLLPRWALFLIFRNVIDAVPVFFAISGFLITYTCIRRFGSLRNIRVPSFYRIRFARIAPLLLLVLAVLSILHLTYASGFRIHAGQATLPQALFAALTFHLNWFEATHGYLPPAWNVLWSLSVEEMFYLFFPLLCMLFLRSRSGRVLFALLLGTLIVIGPFARQVWSAGNELWREESYLGGTDCIALGCMTALLLAWCQRRGRQPSERTLLAIVWAGVGIILALIWPWHTAWRRPLGQSGTWNTVMILAVCAVLFGTVLRNRAGRPWSAPIRWFGRHSYEIYMTHEFVVVWMTALCLRYGRTSGPALLVWAFAMAALSAPVGWLTAKYVSEPMNRRLRGAMPPQPAPRLS